MGARVTILRSVFYLVFDLNLHPRVNLSNRVAAFRPRTTPERCHFFLVLACGSGEPDQGPEVRVQTVCTEGKNHGNAADM